MKGYLNKGAAVRNLSEIGTGTGSKLRIKATITGKNATPNSVVDAVIVETDPDSGISNDVFIGTIENGTFDEEYTTSDFVSNPTISLKFVMHDSSLNKQVNDGGNSTDVATFFVDNLRIDNVYITNQNYDDRGRITDNITGNYVYSNTSKPYQNTSILTGEGSPKPTFALVQSITYNAFKAPIQIVNLVDSKSISFGYNGDEQRSAMYYGSSATDKLARPNRRYYSADGSMEISATFASGNTTTPVTTEFLTYIGGTAYDATVVLKYDGTTYNYFYLHRDYQSSILAITNATGGVVEKRLFDPWGAVTQVQDGAGNNLGVLTFFDRGYTGHEHLQSVNLINMNARLYNPTLHRFLEADNYLQDPYNTQNYNRYGYCVNNPLKYTDSTGNFIDGGVIEAIVIGAIISALAYSASSLMNHTPFTFQGAITSVVIGAFTGAATFGIGEGVLGINNFFVRSSVQSLCYGMFQGGMTAGFNGGKFWAGFAAGCISSLASSAWSGGDSSDGVYHHQGISGATGLDNGAGTIAFGTLSGGAGSALTGGNFWEGAVTGLFVSGLNHLMHDGNRNNTETVDTDGGCPDCPKKGGLSSFNSKDGNTYTYRNGNWVLVGPTDFKPITVDTSPNNKTFISPPGTPTSKSIFGTNNTPFGSSPMGAGTNDVDGQNDLLYFAQAVSNGGTMIINGTKFIYNSLFTFKLMNPAPPPVDSSHIGF